MHWKDAQHRWASSSTDAAAYKFHIPVASLPYPVGDNLLNGYTRRRLLLDHLDTVWSGDAHSLATPQDASQVTHAAKVRGKRSPSDRDCFVAAEMAELLLRLASGKAYCSAGLSTSAFPAVQWQVLTRHLTAPQMTKEEGILDITLPAETLHNQVGLDESSETEQTLAVRLSYTSLMVASLIATAAVHGLGMQSSHSP